MLRCYLSRVSWQQRVCNPFDFMCLPPYADAPADEDAASDESAAAVQAVLSGAVAKIVYKSAIEAVPRNLPFRMKLLQTLGPFDFPGISSLADQVYNSIRQDFEEVRFIAQTLAGLLWYIHHLYDTE